MNTSSRLADVQMRPDSGIPRMTHFQGQRDAFLKGDDALKVQTEWMACKGCGALLVQRRFWQSHCSARCRQRAYVTRQVVMMLGYYGA